MSKHNATQSLLSKQLDKRPKNEITNDISPNTSKSNVDIEKLSNSPDLPQCLQAIKDQNSQPPIVSTSMNVCNEFTTNVGYFVPKKEIVLNSNKITDTMKYKLLEMTYIPSDNFVYPFRYT